MAELFENLEIKWQLLLAQAVNFLILLFVLKKFLYKPMLRFLRERREGIAEGLKKSELAEQKFQEMRVVQARELAKTRKEAQGIIEEAKKRANEAKNEIVANAKQETEGVFKKAEKDIEQMKNQRLEEAEQEIGKLALAGMEYLLREKMTEEKRATLQEEAIAHIKSTKNAS
ncbi:MAG: F0F1 ATP synthase subunit B [Candidatus Spechtbacterales bacterium]